MRYMAIKYAKRMDLFKKSELGEILKLIEQQGQSFAVADWPGGEDAAGRREEMAQHLAGRMGWNSEGKSWTRSWYPCVHERT